jgi:hypothetical protein
MKNQTSISESTLRALKTKGVVSSVLDARLEMASAAQCLSNYIEPLVGCERVHPRMLPTQTSGRWSTKDPPMVNIPHQYRDLVCPDPGTFWVHWDWDSIEARIVACYSHDQGDLAAFRNGWDIHTLTMCRMVGVNPSNNLTNPHQDQEWLAKIEKRLGRSWEGKDDRMRVRAKVAHLDRQRCGLARAHRARTSQDGQSLSGLKTQPNGLEAESMGRVCQYQRGPDLLGKAEETFWHPQGDCQARTKPLGSRGSGGVDESGSQGHLPRHLPKPSGTMLPKP